MQPLEIRHRVIQALLQASGPLSLAEVAAEAGLALSATAPALDGLAEEKLAAAGKLLPDDDTVCYRWAARWQVEVGRRAGDARDRAVAAVGAVSRVPDQRLWLDSSPVEAFHRFVIEDYEPPRIKRLLVFLQCSVRRPFSSSPSHAFMRRAIAVATGDDPAHDFRQCPVHVVVLASKVGPAPYELEDVYPVNVRAGGVKHFDNATYAAARPVLAQRMADYISTHGSHYDAMWTFTDGRYGEVMADAARIAGVDLAVLPRHGGCCVTRLGTSVPRTYWQKYWIQLTLEIVPHLAPHEQEEASRRLQELGAVYG